MITGKLSKKDQSGATLIVALVILAVVTVLGIASIRTSNLELKMSVSQRDRSVAFQTAETALRVIENEIAQLSFYEGQFTCQGLNCFDDDCSDGLCFGGSFDPTAGYSNCSLVDDNGIAPQYWKDLNRWETVPTVSIPKVLSGGSDESADNQVRYIREFMCFVPDPTAQSAESEAKLPLFRVTVMAEGEAGRSSVMLQSVFRGRELLK